MLSPQLINSNITTDTIPIRAVLESIQNDYTSRNKSTYWSVDCKLTAAKPSVIKGFAHSNSFLTLVSPWALQVSGKALVQRFLDALTLRIPITMTLKHIFSAVDTYALGQSLWTEKLHLD